MRVCDNGRIAGMLAWASLLLAAAGGCARGRVFTAQQLPPGLAAPPVPNSQVLDLSRFAGPPISSEQIHAGDVLEVSIAAGLGADQVTTFPVRVTESGIALMPEIGQVPLAGLELCGAERSIAAACLHRNLYRNPHVTVTMKRPRLNRVTVVGAVNEPGIYELPHGSSYLLEAIVAAGGLAEDAGTNVEIRRPNASGSRLAGPAPGFGPEDIQLAGGTAASGAGSSFTRLDLAELVRRGGADEYLPDSSAIMIERRQPQPIEVIGLVRKPGQYELPPNQELRVLGAIAMTGGLSNPLADKVLVLRTDPQTNETVIIKLGVQKAKRNRKENIRLAPGDVVAVERTPATLFMDALNFVRFTFGGHVPLL